MRMQVIHIYANNMLRNFTYILRKEDRVFNIDPFASEPVEAYLKSNNLMLEGILNTHQHYDHIQGNKALQMEYSCPVIKDEYIRFDDESYIKRIQTPGHTADHVSFVYYEDGVERIIFCGDTIFNGGVGNCKNGGDAGVLYNSVTNIYKEFSPQAMIYTGHDYRLNNLKFAKSIWPENAGIDDLMNWEEENQKQKKYEFSSLEVEFEINPFFNLEVFRKKYDLENDKDTFVYLRRLRDQW
jgi:hydroxyacylglutathione hydrolase